MCVMVRGEIDVTRTIRLKPLLVAVAIPLAVGAASELLSGDIRATYQALALPAFAPPPWVFAVVWPVLFVLMGIASYLVWDTPRDGARTQALTFYAVQLLLNFIWSPMFFRFGMYKAALWELCALLVMAAVTAVCFARLDRRTVWLMTPYLLWLAYAGVLTRAIAAIN